MPDFLFGASLLELGLSHFLPYVWILGLLWLLLMAPLLWMRFRLRLEMSGLGYAPLPSRSYLIPALAGAGVLIALAAYAIAWFEGPIPEDLRDHPAVASAFGWVLGLTGMAAALSLRWIRWAGYALGLLAANAAVFLGIPAGVPFLATGLLMAACGLYSFLRYTRRHPELLGNQALRASR